MAMDFVAPLPGALSRTPALQAQGAQGASFRSAAPREAGPNVWLQSSRGGSLLDTALTSVALAATFAGRQVGRSRLAKVQRLSIKGEVPEGLTDPPTYPGTEDPEKLMKFARDLCDFYRSSSQARLPLGDTERLLEDAVRLFSQEATLVDIEVPIGEHVNVVGDVHGQLFDFLSIFEANGWPSEENRFLFNGDFVDRGSYSVEIMLILLAFKLALPKHFFLSRGNHEDEIMNHNYGFTGEVLAKYDVELKIFVAFQRVFMCLPLAHVVNHDVFVTHGGLPRISKNLSLDTIAAVDRIKVSQDDPRQPREPQEEDIIYNDLMWSDPFEGAGIRGSERGGSARQFGADITEEFLAKNDLSFMIRSHEVKDEGYEWMHNKKCLTVFSAPGYCDSCRNRGAVVRLHAEEDEGRLRPEIRPFDTAEKPQDYVYAMSYASSTYQLWNEALRKAGIN
mmetsp:Transcript_46877/g.102027  ORF Transcript_46877/g.102027 Transcript_46877/m.102027 type:complete len:450 (-) Transcript_46877:33-1382(-)